MSHNIMYNKKIDTRTKIFVSKAKQNSSVQTINQMPYKSTRWQNVYPKIVNKT